MSPRLTKQAFRQTLNDYQPLPWERFGDSDPRFVRPLHHALKCQDRFYVALRAGLHRLLPGQRTVVDFGPYPGTLLRLVRTLCESKEVRLVGAGLLTTAEFSRVMREECGAEILTVNLDPQNRQFAAKGYPARVPLDDQTADVVFALEIIEHLTSPFHLLGEAFRILVPGGHLVMTTPNVTRIGNVFKLLIGRTPHDRLAPPGYDNPDDEWQPHVREYAMGELSQMLRQTGFHVAEQRFFLGEDTQDCVQQTKQRFIDLAKIPFFAVPHLRGSLLIVGRKPA
jgi:SAM-dependent methyltransferase